MKTFLFDFDGTLVDSMPAYVGVMIRILEENGIEYPSDLVKIITPLGYGGTAKYYKTLGMPGTEEEIVEKMHAYARKEYAENIPAKCGVKEALIALKAAGCSLNVLTASPHSMLDVCLQRLGLYDLFVNVWSCEDFNTTKADPNIYKMAAEKLGCEVQDVIFLDDNYNALATAKGAGMHVYGVYDQSSDEYAEEIKALTEKYVENFLQLL